MAINSISQPTQQQQDGPLYNETIGEYEIWLNGQIVNYAASQGRAYSAYSEALHTSREHIERNPANCILWTNIVSGETRVLVAG